jgi:hypothetical protein
MTTIFTSTIQFNRTDLTEYETEKLHLAQLRVRDHSLAVGAFMTRYGQLEVLREAGDLHTFLTESLMADKDIRTGALGYGYEMELSRSNDRHAAQARQLCAAFLADVYASVIASRKIGA